MGAKRNKYKEERWKTWSWRLSHLWNGCVRLNQETENCSERTEIMRGLLLTVQYYREETQVGGRWKEVEVKWVGF